MIFVAGCSPTAVKGGRSRAADLEKIISDQLPGQMRKHYGVEGIVNRVICIETGVSNRLDCMARVNALSYGTPGSGGAQTIPITGFCDDANCTWREAR